MSPMSEPIVRELKLPPLYKKQRRAIYAPERYSIIEASTKCGKTVGCMCWIVGEAWVIRIRAQL